MVQTVLVADDEERMRKLIRDFLRNSGFRVLEAEDGRKALDLFREDGGVDVVILDVMMPVLDGWSVCRELRKLSQVPVIMLTARAEESDQLFGYDLGVDEYVTKPFSPSVLVKRVQALLKRAADVHNGRDDMERSGIVIDRSGRRVTIDGSPVDLSPKEYELLLYLIENEGIALSRDQILNAVWGYDYFGDTRTVDTHIKKVRLKLGRKGNFIQTVWSFGYRFEARA